MTSEDLIDEFFRIDRNRDFYSAEAHSALEELADFITTSDTLRVEFKTPLMCPGCHMDLTAVQTVLEKVKEAVGKD
jgi:hypothetical protein